MKKILLTTAAVLTLATSSTYATCEEKGEFYVKGQVGWDKLDKIKGMKSKDGVFLGAGVGYYVMDKVRADLTFDHYINSHHKGTATYNNNTQVLDTKLKSQADTLMINGFVDMFDVSVAKIFAGAGVGMSMISAKATDAGSNDTTKYKKKNNFAYALHLGASTEFAPGISGELTYSYRDMGKFKTPDNAPSLSALKGHHIAAGVRFDI